MCAGGRSKVNFLESVLIFHHVGPKLALQLAGLVANAFTGKPLCPPSLEFSAVIHLVFKYFLN